MHDHRAGTAGLRGRPLALEVDAGLDPGEVYLEGGSIFGTREGSHGWVEKLDPSCSSRAGDRPTWPRAATTGAGPSACTRTATSTC